MFTSTLILATFANIFLHTKCCLKISTEIEGNGYIVAFVSTPETKGNCFFQYIITSFIAEDNILNFKRKNV